MCIKNIFLEGILTLVFNCVEKKNQHPTHQVIIRENTQK